MDSYKLAIIWGKDEKERNIKDGQIDCYGKIDEESLHILNLLEIARLKYKDVPLFQVLNERHLPEIAAYIFTLAGHVVFLNLTKNVKLYGKTGLFLMPKELTDKEQEAFLSMQDELQDYSYIEMAYNLELVDGMLDCDTTRTDRGNLKELLDKYLGNTFIKK